MLPEIAAEALHFLPRRDLDKACAVSVWLDAMISQCCSVYPLRPVRKVALYPLGDDLKLNVSSFDEVHSEISNSFSSLDEAAHHTGCILRHSFVEDFDVNI